VAAREPLTPGRRRLLGEEILVVLSLSLLASAVYAIIDLFSAPVKGVTAVTFPQVPLAPQIAGIAFGLAPVWLVFHLLRRDGLGTEHIGLPAKPPARALAAGVLLFAVVGAVGLGVYFGAVALGVNRFVVPVPPTGYWWTLPVLFLGAAQVALLEEVVDLGYLMTRLRESGWGPGPVLAASALLRGSYHLYQGWGGFVGNLLLGVFFGILFLRRGRLWPMVIAHFLLDVGAGVGYLVFRGHLPGL